MNTDRVSYRISRKISDNAFGSIEYCFFMETNVNEGESPDGATRRCITLCEALMKEKLQLAAKKFSQKAEKQVSP